MPPPLYYKGKLSPESVDDRAEVEQRLKTLESQISAEPSVMKKLKLAAKSEYLQRLLDWQGAHPRDIPFAELKEAVRYPSDSDPAVNIPKARIKNRATAIRAYCIGSCMAGQPALVRECVSITCALWAFRMGKDPLRGYDIKALEIEIDDEDEDDDDFEDGATGDQSDGD